MKSTPAAAKAARPTSKALARSVTLRALDRSQPLLVLGQCGQHPGLVGSGPIPGSTLDPFGEFGQMIRQARIQCSR